MSGAWIAATIAVATLVVAAIVAVAVMRARRKKAAARSRDPRAEVRAALDGAWKKLAQKVPARADREKLARVMVLGDSAAGKTSLVAAAGTGTRTPLAGDKDPDALVRLDLVGSALFIEVSGRLVNVREEDDEEQDAFVELLRGLRGAHAARPLDLLVVAVPCPSLLGTDGAPPASSKQAASSVRKRLSQIERDLSLLPPVYLIVTSTDAVDGFHAFVEALPEAMRHAVLGWSSPHGPTATSVTDWTGEALTAVKADIAEAQERRFLSDVPLRDPEGYYLFATQLGAVEQPLGAYVDEIFFPTQGGEGFVLRGIYFTGAMNEAAPPAPTVLPGMPPAAPPERPLAFARELFDRKIFPEVGLVRPSARARASRRRAVLALQIAAGCTMVVCSIFLWIEAARLDRQVASISPLLQEISSSLVDAQAGEADSSDGARTGASRGFFKAVNGVGTDRLRSFLLPASWLSPVDERIETAVAKGYRGVVLKSYSKQLPLRVLPLEAETTGPYVPMGGEMSLEKTPEFVRLEAWLRDLSAFETNVARYGRLLESVDPEGTSGDGRVQDVSGIAYYLWGSKVEPGRHWQYYRRAISRQPFADALDLEPHRLPVQQRAERLFLALSDRQLEMHHEQVLRADFAAIQQGLADLEAGGKDLTPEKLWALRDAIGRAESRLGAPVLGWITTEAPPANAGLERLFEIVGKSTLLGKDLEQKLRNLGQNRLLLLKGNLLGAEAPVCGAVLAYKDGVAQPQLSPCVLALKAPLDALRGQPYMTITASGTLPDDGDDGRLVWDVELLKEASAIPKQLETFLQEGGLKVTHPNLVATVETLKGVAARAVRTNVMGRVTKAAQRGSSLSDTRAEVANFSQASAPLREILSAFGRIHVDDARDRLRALVRAQGGRLLSQAYGELSQAALYAIEGGTFAWWDGDGTPAFRAFGVDDLGQLTEYSATQRARTESFSKELAEPTLTALESSEIGADDKSTPQIASWRRVVLPLRDYENKKAGNSVSSLERLLLNELPNITIDNCLAELDRSSRRRNPDYFSDRRAEVIERLRARCLQLSAGNIRIRYSSLRRSFNRDLAGRFPFAKLLANAAVEDAPVDTVRRVLAASDDVRKRYRAALLARGDASARDVARFLDKMEAVRTFLAPVLSPTDSSIDGFYDARVDFRVNQAREVGGYQIAEWGLRVAEERIVLGGPKSSVRWRLEDPVKFQLRWAKNSPDIPTPKQNDEDRWAIVGREATTEEQGIWALLRFIARHQIVLRDDEGGDSAGHTLLFSARTVPDPEGGFLDRVGDDSSIVRVFIRIFLVGTEKDKLLKYPDFPLQAPALTGGEQEGEKG
jgi:type VI secretion system protein ImpL